MRVELALDRLFFFFVGCNVSRTILYVFNIADVSYVVFSTETRQIIIQCSIIYCASKCAKLATTYFIENDITVKEHSVMPNRTQQNMPPIVEY